MSFEVLETARGIEVFVQAEKRESLFGDAIAVSLDLLYGSRPGVPDPLGRVWPIQGTGKDDKEILFNLLRAVVDASAESLQQLLPPKWTAFDEGRVTATLLVSSAAAPVVALDVSEVTDCEISALGGRARIHFSKT